MRSGSAAGINTYAAIRTSVEKKNLCTLKFVVNHLCDYQKQSIKLSYTVTLNTRNNFKPVRRYTRMCLLLHTSSCIGLSLSLMLFSLKKLSSQISKKEKKKKKEIFNKRFYTNIWHETLCNFFSIM